MSDKQKLYYITVSNSILYVYFRIIFINKTYIYIMYN